MKITSFAVIALLLIAATLNSQTIKPKSIYAKQKTIEIGGDIMLYSSEYVYERSIYSNGGSSTVAVFQIDGSFGYFVIDHLKFSIEPAITYSTYKNNSSSNLKLYITPEYVFTTKTPVYPFIGCSAGYTSNSYSDSRSDGGFSWGAKGGAKINAFGNALINVGVSYYRETYNYNDSYAGELKRYYNIIGIDAGLSIFFR